VAKLCRNVQIAGASRRRSRSFGFGVAPGARSGDRPTGLEAAGMELASGMGFPPLLATKSNYHLFFKDVNLFGEFLKKIDKLFGDVVLKAKLSQPRG